MKLDAELFYSDLDSVRRKFDMTWQGLGEYLGVSNAMFSRIKSGQNVSLGMFMFLCHWLGEDPFKYFLNEPIAQGLSKDQRTDDPIFMMDDIALATVGTQGINLLRGFIPNHEIKRFRKWLEDK